MFKMTLNRTVWTGILLVSVCIVLYRYFGKTAIYTVCESSQNRSPVMENKKIFHFLLSYINTSAHRTWFAFADDPYGWATSKLCQVSRLPNARVKTVNELLLCLIIQTFLNRFKRCKYVFGLSKCSTKRH